MYIHIYVCLFTCVSLCDNSFVLSPLHTPEFLNTHIYSPGDSMTYCSSLIKIQGFYSSALVFCFNASYIKT